MLGLIVPHSAVDWSIFSSSTRSARSDESPVEQKEMTGADELERRSMGCCGVSFVACVMRTSWRTFDGCHMCVPQLDAATVAR